jgi:hypothetical protein
MRALLIAAVSLLYLAGPSLVLADPIVVATSASDEEKRLELPQFAKAKLIVYLKSSGEPLDGLVVELRRLGADLSQKEERSEANGIVSFSGLTPGRYRFELRRTPQTGPSIGIGDFNIVPAD